MLKNKPLEQAVNAGISYESYRLLVDELVNEGKTTGPIQSEKLIDYTKLNAARMRRWEKKYNPSVNFQRVAQMAQPAESWLVLTEAWCGDAAHNLPFIAKMAGLLKNVSLRLVLREEHPELMDLFLTEGSRSIPKLIRLDEKLTVLGTWGPRPASLQTLAMQMKRSQNVSKEEFSETIQTWYNANKGQEIEAEFISILQNTIPGWFRVDLNKTF